MKKTMNVPDEGPLTADYGEAELAHMAELSEMYRQATPGSPRRARLESEIFTMHELFARFPGSRFLEEES